MILKCLICKDPLSVVSDTDSMQLLLDEHKAGYKRGLEKALDFVNKERDAMANAKKSISQLIYTCSDIDQRIREELSRLEKKESVMQLKKPSTQVCGDSWKVESGPDAQDQFDATDIEKEEKGFKCPKCNREYPNDGHCHWDHPEVNLEKK